jgi:hypothetical protein
MTDVIKLEAECLTDLAKKLQSARSALQTALPKLKTARMSSGWFTSSREVINNDIDTMMREITNRGDDLNRLASILLQGATTYAGWENNLKSSESNLSSTLSKVWAFEAENFESGANADKKAQVAITNIPQNPNGGSTGAVNDNGSNNSGRSYDEADYQKYKSAHGKNCYGFVNQVLQDEGRGPLTGYNGSYSLNGKTPIANGQVVYDAGNPLTAEDIKNMFANAQPGDVVQMRWTWGSATSPHTAIFAGFNDNGDVLFLESNVDLTGESQADVSIHPYSYEKLKSLYSHGGNGASIYRI